MLTIFPIFTNFVTCKNKEGIYGIWSELWIIVQVFAQVSKVLHWSHVFLVFFFYFLLDVVLELM